jgi:hypothetical protein
MLSLNYNRDILRRKFRKENDLIVEKLKSLVKKMSDMTKRPKLRPSAEQILNERRSYFINFTDIKEIFITKRKSIFKNIDLSYKSVLFLRILKERLYLDLCREFIAKSVNFYNNKMESFLNEINYCSDDVFETFEIGSRKKTMNNLKKDFFFKLENQSFDYKIDLEKELNKSLNKHIMKFHETCKLMEAKKELNPYFVKKMKELFSVFFDSESSDVKVISGLQITGRDLLTYFEDYIKIFNSDKLNPEDLLEVTAKASDYKIIIDLKVKQKKIFWLSKC